MKKKLDTTIMVNELRGNSAFFPTHQSRATQPHVTPPVPPHSLHNQQPQNMPLSHHPSIERVAQPEPLTAQSTTPAQASKSASELAGYHASTIETIRKAVKDVGKEVMFIRLTQEEKQQLADITYTYKRQGIKTSENEIGRIAMRFLLEDYERHGESSMLAKVIAALRA